jgi:S-adenosylmethionine:tRNA ribosyltransferase-isomerase
LVLNNTKVFPARLFGKKDTGGKTEILLLKQTGLNTFVCLVRGKVKLSQKLIFAKDLSAEVLKKLPDGELELGFSLSGAELLEKIDKIGKTPLPPYIHSQKNETELRQKYQTIYAKYSGSAAAPTAGLHFTPELLDSIKNKDIQIEYLTLHVGLGTFKPILKSSRNKTLHSENIALLKGLPTG